MDTAAAALDFLFPQRKDDGVDMQPADDASKVATPEVVAPVVSAPPLEPNPGTA